MRGDRTAGIRSLFNIDYSGGGKKGKEKESEKQLGLEKS